MGTSQQFSLRWNNYLKHITSAFDTLRCDEDLVDVTLSCEGKRIRAHKMLLSACSTYFRDLFKENPCQHPVIIFRNVKFDDLAALVDFIYQGEVNVVQEQLDSFMTTAELLAVQGLTDGTRRDDSVEEEVEIPSEPEVQLRNPSGKLITNNRRHKSPASPQETHRSEAPGPKRRRIRENNTHTEKSTRHTVTSPKESDNGKVDPKAGSDPVEIIPIMPGLKMEIPEYLEQDGGSSCSYEEQSVECPRIVMEEEENITDGDKPDIGQPFYQADTLDVSKSSDIGYLLAKPGTSAGNRTSHDSRDSHDRSLVIEQPSHSCKLCGKSFWNRDSMYKHMNMHKGTTQCPVCQKVLSRTTHMKRHLRNRHGWVGSSSDPIAPQTAAALAAAAAAAATAGAGGGATNATTTIANATSATLATTTTPAGGAAASTTTSANRTTTTATSNAATPSRSSSSATGGNGVETSAGPGFTTIRIRESSVERITSSPIP
ncbi:zinc finger and BTB domain-containing protein 14-like isoform X1 [Trichogramma pretiosum]|uniref:zinc finger and BTB domain-containing protein 14-like isoform X1 n=1 Tax=Trichogramma pretiosum TaxID=7493 RepID=UPI0006C98198|nr:zinc finger and BTB domain-containing protein 14-like isoform X1 [Trichogramma pretiosum]XP_014223411.1 zinc finger and BTB domain-containing protein 14-like isoform X1 [Trichogramma pretiosum]